MNGVIPGRRHRRFGRIRDRPGVDRAAAPGYALSTINGKHGQEAPQFSDTCFRDTKSRDRQLHGHQHRHGSGIQEQQRQQPRQQKHQQEQLRLYQHKPQHKPTSRAPPESSDVPLKSIPDVVDAVTQQKLYKQLNGESQMQKKVLPLGVGVLCRSNEITIHNGMHT